VAGKSAVLKVSHERAALALIIVPLPPGHPAWVKRFLSRQVSWLTVIGLAPTFPAGSTGQWHHGVNAPLTVAGAPGSSGHVHPPPVPS